MTEAEWLAATDPGPILKFMNERVSDRKLRLFAVACCRRVWHQMVDERSRKCVEVIESHIEGQATDEEMKVADSQAEEAFRSLQEKIFASVVGAQLAYQARNEPRGLFGLIDPQRATFAHHAADCDPIALSASAVWGAASLTAALQTAGYSPLEAAICVASQTSDPAPNSQTEKANQACILRDIFGNPFRPVAVDPAWLSSTAVAVAHGIYDDKAFDRLPILADALQDAGCENADLLNHLRGDGPHVRGCWALDLVLGKE